MKDYIKDYHRALAAEKIYDEIRGSVGETAATEYLLNLIHRAEDMNEEYFGDCGLGLLEYVMEIPWAEMGRVTMDMIQAVSGIGVVVIGLTALTASGGALGGAAAALLAGNAVNLSGIAGTLATFLCGLGNVTMGTADLMQGIGDLIRALQNDPEHAGHMIIDKLQFFQDHPWAYALLETAMTMGASYGQRLIQSGKIPVVDQKATGIWEKANSGLLAESGSTSSKGLIGHDFEDYLPQNIGGDGSFSVGGRDFDGGIGNRWWEAKSGQYWHMLESNPNKLAKFKSDMGDRLRIATENGATYELFSNIPIPDSIKQWLTKKGIAYTELLD